MTTSELTGAMDPISEGLSEEDWLRAAASNPAFLELADPEEDLYSLEDGASFGEVD
jgi:hypothetical protein